MAAKTPAIDLRLIPRLKRFGLSAEMAEVYLRLLHDGPQTALQLARSSAYSRTQVYRHLEDLERLQLVSAAHFPHRSVFEALPYQQLEGVIASKEAETQSLKNSLGAMKTLFEQFGHISEGKRAKVLHYSGVAGLKQVNWNLTHADGEFRVFEVSHISSFLDKAFAIRHRERCIEKKIHTYDLMNSPTTPLADLQPFDPKLSKLRYIDPKVLTINFEMCIYNDVVTLLDYKAPEIFCMEIYHPALKMMQQQLFDAMWQQATPVKLT